MPGTPTTKYSIPTLNASGTDAINTSHTTLNSAMTTIDAAMAGYAEGTFAGKPAAGKAGRIYRCTDTGQWLADTGSAWVDLNAAPTLVSSLPGSPFDGQEIYYSADATNGVVWHLRYRSAAGGSYKWESVGANSPLTAEVLTNEVPGTSYGDMATIGPSITVPLAGDYEITLSATGSSSTGSNQLLAAPKFGAAAAVDADAIELLVTGLLQLAISRTIRRNVSSAAMVVKMVYKLPTGGISGSFLRRNLSIKPIRVG